MKTFGVLLLFFCILAETQAARKLSSDEQLAPRAALLEGTAADTSPSGKYVITFPQPNECVVLRASGDSRFEALYRAVSLGGFSLKPGNGGLTVWTAEEMDAFEKSDPGFVKAQNEHCASKN